VRRRWFVVFSASVAVTVFGSFIGVTLWSLLFGPVDFLFPIKVVIFLGYCGMLLHIVRGERDMGGLIFASVEILAIIATVVRLLPLILGFYQTTMYVYLGGTLGIEVSLVAALALIIPLLFLVFAGLAIPLAIEYGGLRRPSSCGKTRVVLAKAPPSREELDRQIREIGDLLDKITSPANEKTQETE
jgi:hypothetical protein